MSSAVLVLMFINNITPGERTFRWLRSILWCPPSPPPPGRPRLAAHSNWEVVMFFSTTRSGFTSVVCCQDDYLREGGRTEMILTSTPSPPPQMEVHSHRYTHSLEDIRGKSRESDRNSLLHSKGSSLSTRLASDILSLHWWVTTFFDFISKCTLSK